MAGRLVLSSALLSQSKLIDRSEKSATYRVVPSSQWDFDDKVDSLQADSCILANVNGSITVIYYGEDLQDLQTNGRSCCLLM